MGRINQLLLETIFVPKGNLGIPRRNMPQIEDSDQKEFFSYMKKNGGGVSKEKIKATLIKPIQKEIRADIVKQLVKKDSKKLQKPLIVSKDNFLLDGHHRWLALLNIDKDIEVQVVKIGLPMKKLLDLARKFPKVVYKDVNNKQFDDIDPKLKVS